MPAPPANRYMTSHTLVLGLIKIFALFFSQLPIASAAPAFSLSLAHAAESPEPASEPGLWLYMSIAAALVLSGGAFAGLTIALMGQDEVYLQVIKTSGESAERKNAASVLHLIQKGKHWVLVTLLLSNVITNETLPIILDRSLGGGWPAILGSTVLIVIFGEIVPQSICVRYGLPIGAWMAPCVLILMYIMSPIAWPIAKLLDTLLGKDHGTIYKKAGLKTLVTLHKNLGEAGEQLNSDEVTIISAVLDLKEKAVGSIMTPMEDVFTMSADAVLDEPTMDLILSQGYSRVPIHAPDNPMNFVGMLLVKMLITYDPEDCKTVRDFALATLPETRPETSCLDIVNFFQEGKSHMVLLSEYPGEDRGALGVVTLEDVIEELIGEEIIDESDVFVDVHKAIRRMTPAPNSRVPKGKIVEDPTKVSSMVDGDSAEAGRDTKSTKPPDDRRQSSVEAPPPRFQLRKQHSDPNALSTDGWVTHRGATNEIREHLKHLGPSNLASRPRQTRYQSVKIKRGSGSPTRSAQTDVDSGRSISEAPRYAAPTGHQGGIGAGILNSAGQDAKDGVHALKLGYGTMSTASTPATISTSTTPEPANLKDIPQVSIPEAVTEEQDDRSRHDDQPRSNQESATVSVRSSDSQNGDRGKTPAGGYRHRGPARSGSITEQVVDVNGIRKVVLYTTSSPSSSETEGRAPPHKSHQHQHNGERSHPVSDNENRDGDELSPKGTLSTNGTKKKRRRKSRRRRGNSSKKSDSRQSDEQQPLLSQ